MTALSNISINIVDLKEIRDDIQRYIKAGTNIDNLINLQKRNLIREIRNNEQALTGLTEEELNTKLDTVLDHTDQNIKDKLILMTIAEIFRASSNSGLNDLTTSYQNSANRIALEYNFDETDKINNSPPIIGR